MDAEAAAIFVGWESWQHSAAAWDGGGCHDTTSGQQRVGCRGNLSGDDIANAAGRAVRHQESLLGQHQRKGCVVELAARYGWRPAADAAAIVGASLTIGPVQ